MLKTILMVALGGGAGSVLRYAVGLAFARAWASTLAANVVGCFLIGLLAGLAQRQAWLTPEVRALLVTGFCGGFTTFSTFSQQTQQMMASGQMTAAAAYAAGSVALGLCAVWAGMALAGALCRQH